MSPLIRRTRILISTHTQVRHILTSTLTGMLMPIPGGIGRIPILTPRGGGLVSTAVSIRGGFTVALDYTAGSMAGSGASIIRASTVDSVAFTIRASMVDSAAFTIRASLGIREDLLADQPLPAPSEAASPGVLWADLGADQSVGLLADLWAAVSAGVAVLLEATGGVNPGSI